MPINNSSELPTGTTQTIDGVEKTVYTLQERIDLADWNKRFLEDTSDTLSHSLVITDSGGNTHSHTWTGTGGATAFWADWRSSNSSLDGTGNDCDIAAYERWQDFVNDSYTEDGSARTKASLIQEFADDITTANATIAAESNSSEPSE